MCMNSSAVHIQVRVYAAYFIYVWSKYTLFINEDTVTVRLVMPSRGLIVSNENQINSIKQQLTSIKSKPY